jgi:DNA modification methylase
MIIEIKKISELTPAPYNPRESTEKQESQLKQSLKKFGVVEPIIYNKQTGYIVGGHFRVRELQKLGYTEIECVIVDLSEEDEKELNIRLNANTGQWDWDELANNFELDDLNDWGLEVPNMKHELEAEDDNFEEPENIETDIVLGDLFEIGEHRLLCGDSTDSDSVARLMDGQKADMVFTDPPYNISFSGSMSNTTKDGVMIKHKGANQKHEIIKNDAMSDDEFYTFMCDVLKEIKVNCIGAFYICFGSQTLNQLLQPFLDLGMEYKSIIIWMKNQATLSGKDYKGRYEPILYGRFNDGFYGERYKQEDIWEFQRTLKNDLHPTMKPIPLIENALNNSSKIGMKVLDLFLGSGSTMVASHQLKRKCYGMELDPKYCQVIIDRMKKLDPTLVIKRNGIEL